MRDIKGRTFELMIENDVEYATPLQLAPRFKRYFVLSNEHLGRMGEGAIVAMANRHVISSSLIESALGTAGRLEISWLRSVDGVDSQGIRHPGRWHDITRTLARGYTAEVQGQPLTIPGYG